MAITNKQLDAIIQELPGYDPVATRGDCRFDYQAARNAIEFIEECCTFTQGAKAGEPFTLETWEKAIVANLFGWKRPDGARRYREALLFVARGNGKSELAAAIICAILFLDEEPGAQLYSAAAKRDQTHFIFDPVRKMIQACPEMKEQATVFKNSIVVKDRVYKCISREATTEHGGSTHFAVIDELHSQPDRDLVDVLYTSTIKRDNPLILYVTTSDFERSGSIANEKHLYASQVRDGIIQDPSFLPAIFEARLEDDWQIPATWQKANPNLGVSIKEADLAKLCQKAKDIPGFLNTFLRLHLNVRTQSDVRWLPMDKWDSEKIIDPVEWRANKIAELAGMNCTAGLDLSASLDVTAFVLAFRQSGNVILLPFFWIPQANAERRDKRDRVPYTSWARQGFITYTSGDVTDYDIVRRDINELGKQFNIRSIARDRWNASQITNQLMGDGFNMIDFGQGFASMSAPSKEFETLLIGGRLEHGGNPVLRWMASNASAETDAAGNVKPSKKKSTERIDGICAAIMAIGVDLAAPAPEEPTWGILI